MPEKQLTVMVEQTDMFAGEPNYCWVRRTNFRIPETASDRAIIRKVKQALGVAKVRAESATWGDYMELRSRRHGWVAFITFAEG
jgi:hypothetical protein